METSEKPCAMITPAGGHRRRQKESHASCRPPYRGLAHNPSTKGGGAPVSNVAGHSKKATMAGATNEEQQMSKCGG